jgi:dGTP triphosphohydrolase
MARHHDIGHTFLGHSGEWWLSSIKDTYAMPNCVHNAVGARNLMYRYDVPTEIEKEIKKKEPNISNRKLKAIKNDLWLVFDAINGHNGEQSEFSYAPDFTKSRAKFENELMGCYVKKGFDRTIVPATAEGSLMRISDKISYIPYDVVDIFRNKCNKEKLCINGKEYNFYEEYRKIFKDLGMSDDSLDKLLECKTCEEYDDFAKSIQKILIDDVKKNTKRNNIRMSEKTSDAMHKLRDVNNKLMVNYTVLKVDHEQYVPALEKFMNFAGNLLIGDGFIDKKNVRNSTIVDFVENPDKQRELLDSFKDDPLPYGLIEYISHITPQDLEFTVQSCEKAFEETISEEINLARKVAMDNSVDDEKIQAPGHKKERITKYIKDFREMIDVTNQDKFTQSIFDPNSNNSIDKFKRKIWLDRASDRIKAKSIASLEHGAEGIEPLSQMVAMEIGAQYLASLNDEQWFELYKRIAGPSLEIEQDLTRQYNTFDFRGQAKPHKTWEIIAENHANSGDDKEKNTQKSWISKIKNFR